MALANLFGWMKAEDKPATAGCGTACGAGEKPEEKKAEDTKICPHCYNKINIKADRCPYCTSKLNESIENIKDNLNN